MFRGYCFLLGHALRRMVTGRYITGAGIILHAR